MVSLDFSEKLNTSFTALNETFIKPHLRSWNRFETNY